MIKNYTSEAAVSVTIGRIEQILVRSRVIGITKEYDDYGAVIAITFGMPYKGRTIAVRLPVEIEACKEALWREYVGTDSTHGEGDNEQVSFGGKKKKRKDFTDQAQRTAWKIAQDWLEIELTRVQLKQGEMAEIFMAYIWDGNRKQTLFQQYKASGGLLLQEKNPDVVIES